jgi:hypothetical protein
MISAAQRSFVDCWEMQRRMVKLSERIESASVLTSRKQLRVRASLQC